MGTAYDVWRVVMYCVGVFVTCNVGGMLLRWGRNRVMMKHLTDSEQYLRTDSSPRWDSWDSGDSTASTVPREGQTFEDIQRQIRTDTDNESE